MVLPQCHRNRKHLHHRRKYLIYMYLSSIRTECPVNWYKITHFLKDGDCVNRSECQVYFWCRDYAFLVMWMKPMKLWLSKFIFPFCCTLCWHQFFQRNKAVLEKRYMYNETCRERFYIRVFDLICDDKDLHKVKNGENTNPFLLSLFWSAILICLCWITVSLCWRMYMTNIY